MDFFFTQDKLAAVVVQFKRPDPLRDEFSALSELLRMKYGQPVSSVDTAEAAEEDLWRVKSDNDREERATRDCVNWAPTSSAAPPRTP